VMVYGSCDGVLIYFAMGGMVFVDLIEDKNCSHINYDMI